VHVRRVGVSPNRLFERLEEREEGEGNDGVLGSVSRTAISADGATGLAAEKRPRDRTAKEEEENFILCDGVMGGRGVDEL
jgi:hypothetical protein